MLQQGLLYNSNTASSFLSSHTQNSVSSLHLADGLRKKMACGSLRTNKTFQMCGCVTLGCLPIFQLGQQSPLLEKRRAFSSPAKADKARGVRGFSLRAVRVWAGRLFVCCGSERLIIPLAPVTHPCVVPPTAARLYQGQVRRMFCGRTVKHAQVTTLQVTFLRASQNLLLFATSKFLLAIYRAEILSTWWALKYQLEMPS